MCSCSQANAFSACEAKVRQCYESWIVAWPDRFVITYLLVVLQLGDDGSEGRPVLTGCQEDFNEVVIIMGGFRAVRENRTVPTPS